jgi:alpha-1,6-mannosyltransferase
VNLVDIAEFFSERGGGVRSYLSDLAREGSSRGHRVTVIAPGPRDEVCSWNGGELVRLRGPAMPYDPTYHALLRWSDVRALLDRLRPDVVQASAPYAAAHLVASLEGPRRVHVWHSDQLGTYAGPLLERLPAAARSRAERMLGAWPRGLSRRFDATITPSRAVAEELRSWGCERVVPVVFGVRREGFSPERRSPALRRAFLGASADHPRAALLVVACRLAFEKRVALVLEAARVLAERRPVALAILGEGPEHRRLERQARSWPWVTFLGFERDRERYASILASADVLVHGGHAETFGFVLAEALASGTPVVVPASGAALDVARLGAGATYPRGASPPQVAEAIEEVLQRDRAWWTPRTAAAAAALPSVSDHFDRLFALHEALLAGRPLPR